MPEKRKPQTDEIQKQLDKLADKRILVLVSDQRFDKKVITSLSGGYDVKRGQTLY